MANIKEVAALAGVSTTTVSHVINETRFVAEETRERVFAAMRDLNYAPSLVARSLNNSFEAAPMLLYIIIIGILGITIEKLIKTAERRLTSWQEKREI